MSKRLHPSTRAQCIKNTAMPRNQLQSCTERLAQAKTATMHFSTCMAVSKDAWKQAGHTPSLVVTVVYMHIYAAIVAPHYADLCICTTAWGGQPAS
eukprot:scaffold255970_cov22-Tisochrysis_lutea.AAC.1